MQQIFIDVQAKINEKIELDKNQLHHLKNVLRMRNDEVIRVVDKLGLRYYAKVIENPDFTVICFEAIEESMERNHEVTLLVGLIKKEKWDFLLQKSTELGVTRIVPFESMRTVVKSKEEKADKKIERWNKILLEAANQCKRDRVPELCNTIKLKEAANYLSSVNLVAYESMNFSAKKIRECFEVPASSTIVIGPEGGFDESEIKMLNDYGFTCVSLGKRILRAETAVIYALSAIDACIE